LSELTGNRWLIIADDLTGAADAAVAFAQRSMDCRVVSSLDRAQQADVLACNLDSRGADVRVAVERHEAALSTYGGIHRRLFKKIDSILRGHPAEEIASTLRHARAPRGFGLLAPAFPATGRTTVNGHVHVHGRVLESSGSREPEAFSANLVEVLAAVAIKAEVVPLQVVRDVVALPRALQRLKDLGQVAICDAINSSDLEHIAQAGLAIEGSIFIGSAGLARAIASLSAAGSHLAPPFSRRTTPVLAIIGSQAGASHRAVRKLATDPAVLSVMLYERSFDPPADRDAKDQMTAAAEALKSGCDVLIYMDESTEPQLSIRTQVAHNLAAMTTPLLPYAGSLIASGGDTATALFAHAGVHTLRLLDEIEPGICLGLTLGAISIPVVTKSGSFGDEECLLRIAHHLHTLSDT
jgi:uncharacterized protein YgbK (DUF1537 family)